jgi:actin-like ATPase involved in cell morphogenesis
MKDGVIADFEITSAMLREFISRATIAENLSVQESSSAFHSV